MRYLANGTLLLFFMLFLTACTGDSPKIMNFTASPATIQSGSSTTLTAVYVGGTATIDNDVGSIEAGSSVSVKPDVTTTYTLSVIDGAGDKASQSLTVVVGDAPTITSFTATSIVVGASANLTAVFADGTGVINNGVGNVTSGTAVSVSPTSTTTYTITVTNAAGTAVTETATVDVVKLDALSLSVDSPDLQIFDPSQLSYSATVDFLASAIKVKASTVDAGSSIKVNNIAVDANNLSPFISLAPSTNTITITVTKNAVTQTYTLIITRQTKSNLTEQKILHASDKKIDDRFGYRVSISDNTLVVGAIFEDGGTGDPASAAGAAYVFTRSGTSWTQQQILHASDKQENDWFGGSVSISGDTLVVGATREGGGPGDPVSAAGAVYIFTRSGTSWTQQQILHASDAQENDFFGSGVSISGDTLVVGAYSEDGGAGDPAANAGAAYVFTRSGTSWTQQQILHASDKQVSDSFGYAVSISGESLVVGAYTEDGGLNEPAAGAGAAYVFTRSGTTWTEQQILHASDKAINDFFGTEVSISGESLVAGANSADGDAGAAYVFTRSGTIWTQQQKLQASDKKAADLFGSGVSISGDTLVVGAYYEDGGTGDPFSSAGAAYVFTRFGATWSEQKILHASDNAIGDLFGGSVSISGDTLVVGAFYEDGGTGDPASGAGAVYIYQ